MIRRIIDLIFQRGPSVIDYWLLPPKARIRKAEVELREVEDSERKIFHFKLRNGIRRVKNCKVSIESDERGRIYGEQNIGSLRPWPFGTYEEDACKVYPHKVEEVTFEFEVNGYPQTKSISLENQ